MNHPPVSPQRADLEEAAAVVGLLRAMGSLQNLREEVAEEKHDLDVSGNNRIVATPLMSMTNKQTTAADGAAASTGI